MHPLVTRFRWKLYYANRRHFTYPGLTLWTGKRHVRILPLPRRVPRDRDEAA